MKSYWPQKIYVDESARDDELVARFRARLPQAEFEYVASGTDPLAADSIGEPRSAAEVAARFARGKRELVLTRYRGSWLKGCPGTSGHVCCNLYIVNPGEGCPLDCTYCYLQAYLRRNPTLKLYTNTNEMLAAIAERAESEPRRLFRIGTGEVIDSLVWDDLTDFTLDVVPFFARHPNLVLELKTKTTNIANLLSLRDAHGGNTVVSWSVNAAPVSEHDEALTASLDDRLRAAADVAEAGYRVGFHFDPVVHFEGWQDAYREAVKKVLSSVDSSRIAWVSVSSLRYKPEMQQIMEERFPTSKLPYGEQFLAKDGKLRYIQPLRMQLVGFVWNEIRALYPQIPVYMCMESSAAWRNIAGGPPAAGSELVEIFSRRRQYVDDASRTL